jgi:ribosomal protein RSM22 (predicted rRNA methylase)
MRNNISALIDKTFPMPGRFYSTLPSQVAELSRLLTGARGDRSLSYLSRPNFLSAYLRYFLPWNIIRLCKLLPSLDLPLRAKDVIVDLGSGPLTFVSALWLSRPDLRAIPLEFYCVDRCAPALNAGKKFFNAVCAGENCVWKVNTVRENINLKTKTAPARKKAALVCAVNLFNETYEDLPHNNSSALGRITADIALLTHNQASPSGYILTVEPGVPQSGHFISLLRSAFLELGRPPLSPCTHSGNCPMPGGKAAFGKTANIKKRWCHFAYTTEDAPKELQHLSSAARIPKERLVFSYLLTGAQAQATTAQTTEKIRVISDAFPLADKKSGRYGCSEDGLVLLTGDKNRMEKTASGELVSKSGASGERDEKSGALIINLFNNHVS